MSYVILDLEWNGSYSKILHKFVNEIIEFGAVKVDDELKITDTFSVLITPQIGKKLCSKVRELTKITNEELADSGISFLEASERFTEFLGDSVLMTWGTSDIHALIENYSYFTEDYHLPFLKKYCDIQKYCEKSLDMYNPSCQMGLSKCAELLNIDFSADEQHRAFADAELSLKCISKLIDNHPIESYIIDADCDSFYNKMTFKAHFITDLDSPDIDKSQLKFICDCCNKQARRIKNWKLHNKSFSAEFYCKRCDRNFIGRISFKKKFDSITVKKKIIEKSNRKNKNGENIPSESKVN